MSLGVWLEAERKCLATVVGLDSLLFKNATVFIKVPMKRNFLLSYSKELSK